MNSSIDGQEAFWISASVQPSSLNFLGDLDRNVRDYASRGSLMAYHLAQRGIRIKFITSHRERFMRLLGPPFREWVNRNLLLVYSSYAPFWTPYNAKRLVMTANTWFRCVPSGSVLNNLLSFPTFMRAFGLATIALYHLPNDGSPIVATTGPLWGIAGLIASRVTGSPFVFDLPDYLPTYEGIEHISAQIQETLVQNADLVTCASRSLDEFAKTIGASRTLFIPNGFNPELFYPRDMKESRSALGLPENSVILCYAGNLLPRSGVFDLVRATGILRQRGINALLVVLGKGPLSDRVICLGTKLGLDNHLLLRYAVPADISVFLGAADILLAPYLRDERTKFVMVPQKLAEYMACGKPIIVSNVGEISRVVVDGEVGLLSEPGIPEDIAAKVQFLLEHRGKAREIGLSALRESRKLAWPILAAQMVDGLQQIVVK